MGGDLNILHAFAVVLLHDVLEDAAGQPQQFAHHGCAGICRVELGHHDHLITTLIAHDSWTNVQTVAGWIARAAAAAREASASSTDDPQNDTDGL